jgi:hypothetical protein
MRSEWTTGEGGTPMFGAGRAGLAVPVEGGASVFAFQSGAYGAVASPQAFLGKPPASELLTEWHAQCIEELARITGGPTPNLTPEVHHHA